MNIGEQLKSHCALDQTNKANCLTLIFYIWRETFEAMWAGALSWWNTHMTCSLKILIFNRRIWSSIFMLSYIFLAFQEQKNLWNHSEKMLFLFAIQWQRVISSDLKQQQFMKCYCKTKTHPFATVTFLGFSHILWMAYIWYTYFKYTNLILYTCF